MFLSFKNNFIFSTLFLIILHIYIIILLKQLLKNNWK